MNFVELFVIALLVLPAKSSNLDSLIWSINRKKSTWIAGKNFEETSPENLTRLNGALGLHPDPNYEININTHPVPRKSLPDFFNASTQWNFCSSLINNIRNQGNCGSCWAFATAETMSDRLCIETHGSSIFEFSPEDLLQCCSDCGFKCNGGYVTLAWNYLLSQGIVSGGDYNSAKGCKPYSSSAFQYSSVGSCHQTCQKNYKISYKQDKLFGKKLYRITPSVDQIQMEIMTKGPVVAIYTVYEDFYHYQSGVYQHVLGRNMGNHAVKIVGWGTEQGVPYWLIANSWGRNWGALGGFFKILRGRNHCGIEAQITSGQMT